MKFVISGGGMETQIASLMIWFFDNCVIKNCNCKGAKHTMTEFGLDSTGVSAELSLELSEDTTEH